MDVTTAPHPNAAPLPIAPTAPSAEDQLSTAAAPPAIALHDEDESEYETDSDAEPEVPAPSRALLPVRSLTNLC
jgi:hypothetical protein